MIDMNLLRRQPELYRDSAQKRFLSNNIDTLLELDVQSRDMKTQIDTLRSQANTIAKTIGGAKSAQERQELINEGTKIKKLISDKEEQLRQVEQQLHKVSLSIPNLLAEDTPIGQSDEENIVVLTKGQIPQFSFQPLDHLTLGQQLDILDFEAGAKVAGSKFYFLKSEAVLLSMALVQLALSVAMKRGYQPLMTPDLAKDKIVQGAGYNPRREDGESEIYSIEGHDLCLIGTAEIPVGGLHADEIIPSDKLPLKYVAFSHCFRTEAGAAGKRSKGLYRVHQFDKVELFQFTQPSQSEAALEEIRAIEEEIFTLLAIPYRLMRICSGDMGAPAYKKYDIEAWMPGKGDNGEYGEVTSCSNCTDFQSRRLAIRFKDQQTKKNTPVHTLNGTAIAASRALVAVIENYQQADGSVLIPPALRPYMGGLEKITRKTS